MTMKWLIPLLLTALVGVGIYAAMQKNDSDNYRGIVEDCVKGKYEC